MKKLLYFLFLLSIFGCTPKNDLFKTTDYFVNSLYTEYESYGLEGQMYSKTTKNDLYTVFPIGRLINVKIEKPVSSKTYEKLRKSLERHYKNNSRVNKVYICNAGTIMIDCRH